MRYDSLQTRAATLEKLVSDARELLLARAEQIREYERRNGEVSAERNSLHERVSSLQAIAHPRANPNSRKPTRPVRPIWNATARWRAPSPREEAALTEAEDSEASLS